MTMFVCDMISKLFYKVVNRKSVQIYRRKNPSVAGALEALLRYINAIKMRTKKSIQYRRSHKQLYTYTMPWKCLHMFRVKHCGYIEYMHINTETPTRCYA